jgi:hypothetical protein
MPSHHSHTAPDAPTPLQQHYHHQALAEQIGTSFAAPATEALGEIQRLERLQYVERLRAEALRIAENHDQVVRWHREQAVEIEDLKHQLATAVEAERSRIAHWLLQRGEKAIDHGAYSALVKAADDLAARGS